MDYLNSFSGESSESLNSPLNGRFAIVFDKVRIIQVGLWIIHLIQGPHNMVSSKPARSGYVLTALGASKVTKDLEEKKKRGINVTPAWLSSQLSHQSASLTGEAFSVEKDVVAQILRCGRKGNRRNGSDIKNVKLVLKYLGVNPPRLGIDYILYSNENQNYPKTIIISDKVNSSLIKNLVKYIDEKKHIVLVLDRLSEDSSSPGSSNDINTYDCFLLVKSSESSVVKFQDEIGFIQNLQAQDISRNIKVGILHLDSALSLPINHSLIKNLTSLPQEVWPSSDAKTNDDGIYKFWLRLVESQSPRAITDSTQELRNLLGELSRVSALRNGLLTYIGEDQHSLLGNLEKDLANATERRIQSGYSYMGLRSANRWNFACTDKTYHMQRNLANFPRYAQPLFPYLASSAYNFVSLGPGEGTKDKMLIEQCIFQNPSQNPDADFLYIPVDMSLDMIQIAINTVGIQMHNCVPIQRNIEHPSGMKEISDIAKILSAGKPILYGFLGNTISNLENPEDVMTSIHSNMRNEDILMFEAQVLNVETSQQRGDSNKLFQEIENEYRSGAFRGFAESTLLQYTDLPIEVEEIISFYDVEVNSSGLTALGTIEINCFFTNKRDTNVVITLLNRSPIVWKPNERIYLYRSRKFLLTALQQLLQDSGFEIIHSSHGLTESRVSTMVSLLRKRIDER